MYLAPASFNPPLIKRDILQDCKGLIASIENNYALVEQSFNSASAGNKTSNPTLCNLELLFTGKDTPKKDSLKPEWKSPYQLSLINSCSAEL